MLPNSVRTRLLLAPLFLAGLLGCKAQSVRSSYANEFNCPSDRVNVETISANRYRATGCGDVVYHCVDLECFPVYGRLDNSEYVSRAPEPSSAPAAPEQSDRYEVRRIKSGTKSQLALDIAFDKAMLKLRAAPDEQGGLVQMKLVFVSASDEAKDCDLALLINGQLFPNLPTTFSRHRSLVGVRTNLSRALVTELGNASRLAVRACDDRWTLSPDQIARLRRFFELYEEDQAWEGPAGTATAGMMAPIGGWPAWVVEGVPTPANTEGPALESQALFELLAPSVFRLEVVLSDGTSQGSAVAVSKTELLTNCHVVAGARKIVAAQNKKEYVATITRADPATDRCVLSVPDPVLVPVRGVRKYRDLRVGEPAYTVGAPSGLDLTISNGLVSGLREEKDQPLVQTTAPVSPGSSGGGLFDAHGNVIGITSKVLVDRQRLTQALNFAVPAESFWSR